MEGQANIHLPSPRFCNGPDVLWPAGRHWYLDYWFFAFGFLPLWMRFFLPPGGPIRHAIRLIAPLKAFLHFQIVLLSELSFDRIVIVPIR